MRKHEDDAGDGHNDAMKYTRRDLVLGRCVRRGFFRFVLCLVTTGRPSLFITMVIERGVMVPATWTRLNQYSYSFTRFSLVCVSHAARRPASPWYSVIRSSQSICSCWPTCGGAVQRSPSRLSPASLRGRSAERRAHRAAKRYRTVYERAPIR